MNNKFNIGDKVFNKYVPDINGFITDIYEREDVPPAGWLPTATDYNPPKMPLIYMYKVGDHPTYCFEETIEYDKEYYKMVNREDKLKEIGI